MASALLQKLPTNPSDWLNSAWAHISPRFQAERGGFKRRRGLTESTAHVKDNKLPYGP